MKPSQWDQCRRFYGLSQGDRAGVFIEGNYLQGKVTAVSYGGMPWITLDKPYRPKNPKHSTIKRVLGSEVTLAKCIQEVRQRPSNKEPRLGRAA